MNVKLQLKWEPRDLWVGVYWTRKADALFVYVCFLPCLPIVIWLLPEIYYAGGPDDRP
jgi:hypothetical protein